MYRSKIMRILCVDCNLEEISSVNNFIFIFSRPFFWNITYFCRDKSFVDKSSREVVFGLVFRWTIKITATLVCRVIEHDKSNPRMLSLLQKNKSVVDEAWFTVTCFERIKRARNFREVSIQAASNNAALRNTALAAQRSL